MTDIEKARREGMRWQLLNALNKGRPIGAMDVLLLSVMQDLYSDCTVNELHTQLEYLDDRKLIEIVKKPDGHWFSKLTHYGIDIVEYTVDCYPGIARPPKYWKG
ncbi:MULTISPECIES: hypothetical protein [unclassified Acinetobacter]|uniref:hypothetical protein n=1 Tax=unclassified Acinetobacter TaxID=196816 RepID=UPI00190AFDFB|nr:MULTISPECIES: hypothetical protein [unclassified Acinetobacter]MBK0062399.1 hypothetical protein [Acinetobacter sp. S55]MBK0066203.1 hypothetical protein [Acinetobacter sp. S54]